MLEEMKFFATQNALQQQLKDIQSGGAAATTKSPKISRIVAAFDGAASEGQSSALAKPKTTTITSTTPTTAKQNKFVKPRGVQILVVVANTPERPWRTDVEKGFV